MSDRLHIGQAIRDLRRQRNMTGEELGKRAGLSQSRVSKIETGAGANLQPAQAEKILNILDAPQTIRQQIQLALQQTEAVQIRRIKGSFPFEQSLRELRRTKMLRVFTINLIPAMLQTTEYRQAHLSRVDMPGPDFRIAMRTTLKRQDLLWDKRRRFHFIIHETALYTTPGDRAVQIAQLDRLDRLIGTRNIKVGIIALESGTFPVDITSFSVHDEQRVAKAVADADIVSHSAQDIADYLKIFAALDKLADYGDSARTLIHKAIDYFS